MNHHHCCSTMWPIELSTKNKRKNNDKKRSSVDETELCRGNPESRHEDFLFRKVKCVPKFFSQSFVCFCADVSRRRSFRIQYSFSSYTPGLDIIRLLTCILSKSKQGRRWSRCSWWLRGVRFLWRGETANTFAGGLIERKSRDDEDGVDDDPLPFEVVMGLSHDIRIFSMPRPASTRMSGVVERCCTDSGWCGLLRFRCWWFSSRWPRCGFSASNGGDVRKLTGANMLWWWYEWDSRNCLT